MKEQDKRFFKSQKRSLDGFFMEEAKVKRYHLQKDKELKKIMEAKYGADPIIHN